MKGIKEDFHVLWENLPYLLKMTSVERVVEYAELESEAPWEMDTQPPSDWPKKGSITFDRVNFSYSASEPLVLKNLSVVFAPREKVLVLTPPPPLCMLTGVRSRDLG